MIAGLMQEKPSDFHIDKSSEALIHMALDEDRGSGDVTSEAVIDENMLATADMVAREDMVLCGTAVAGRVFELVDSRCRFTVLMEDGRNAARGAALMRITGPARAVLTGERVALNFLQRLSGVATLTATYAAAISGSGCRLLDTRKTTPGWRRLEKYAVQCGGGTNHRSGLFDMVMIKDNHLMTLADRDPQPVITAVRRAREKYPDLRVEVEADRIDQVEAALEAGADIILLDNMDPETIRRAAALCRGKAKTEASGGITLQNIRSVAETGVDFISVGALTHAARNVDIGLDFHPHHAASR